MEHYDLRVIEDCLVFSYEVELPSYPQTSEAVCGSERKSSSRRERQRAKRAARVKKLFLRLLLIVLAPFALLADAGVAVSVRCVQVVRPCLKRGVKYIPAIGTVSCFVLVTAILNFL